MTPSTYLSDTSPSPAIPRWSLRALLLAWTVPVALGTPLAILSLRTAGQGMTLWRVLLIVCATWYVWAAMTPLVARLAERRRLNRPLAPRVLLIHSGAALLACVIQALSAALATQVLAPTPDATFVGVFVY